MRREWTGWIKNRQWDAFEAEAKSDPSQILADTVAELERGFPEKPDRRALRKVLYLLAQAGYEPAEIEIEPEEPTLAARFRRALMVSADMEGSTLVVYAEETRGNVLWIDANIHENDGIVSAAETSTPVLDAPGMFERVRRTIRSPMVCAEVDPDYALYRIARAARRQRRRAPSVVAYWGSILGRATEVEHPTAALPKPKSTPEQRFQVALEALPALPWRLELGVATPLLMGLYQDRERDPDRTKEELQAARDTLVAAKRAEVFDDAIVADHAMRLRDLAAITTSRAPDEAGHILSAALDLEKRGAESDYARAVMEKTLFMLYETLRRDAEREKKGGG